MKKILGIFLFICFALAAHSQGIFKPVKLFPTEAEVMHKISIGETHITQKWLWRFDASIAIVEMNYNKDAKQFISNSFSAVGPAIGYQHYVPTSVLDPTPFNNYGFSAAFLLGQNIYDPQLASFKLALVANVMEYFKFGMTLTPNQSEGISMVGLFFGGGITF